MSEAGLFELVKLETADGGHVGWAMIPRFNTPADVLVWGERIFHDAAAVDADADYRLYREAFAWAVVTPVTGVRPDPAENTCTCPFPRTLCPGCGQDCAACAAAARNT